tara:strand:+ start:2605 stop:3039 length:435 start_codon:yes stop_codon:yes gene_type:complete
MTRRPEDWVTGRFGIIKQTDMGSIKTHKDLKVYQLSFEAGMLIFDATKSFPKEERFSLTDQIRRSSRSVSGNLAEAWRKRRYEKAFITKLSDVEGEAAETQTWLDYAQACDYIENEVHSELFKKYDHILGMVVNMIIHPEKWTL